MCVFLAPSLYYTRFCRLYTILGFATTQMFSGVCQHARAVRRTAPAGAGVSFASRLIIEAADARAALVAQRSNEVVRGLARARSPSSLVPHRCRGVIDPRGYGLSPVGCLSCWSWSCPTRSRPCLSVDPLRASDSRGQAFLVVVVVVAGGLHSTAREFPPFGSIPPGRPLAV